MSTTRIPRDQLVYGFNAETPPVATIQPGDEVIFETYDTSTGRIFEPDDVPKFVAVRDPKKVNPAAGPVYVEGAEPGDALAVDVLDITLTGVGFARALKNAGVLQDGIREFGVAMVRVEGGDLIFAEKLRFPARPMIGVIGTAPAEGTVYTAHPGPNGSNIDVNSIKRGATVYLPVCVPGALLAIGDIHASMGEGEVCGTGVEIRGEATVRVRLLKGEAPRRIWLETPEDWITTGQGESLDEAVRESVEEMTQLLMKRFALDRTEAFLLVSARGDVRIGQSARIPGCDATTYVMFPKSVHRVEVALCEPKP
ncbi:MAG TPA: acetamidase/formamidase family protein [Chthoniobacteraceae bacterium]|jgi:amidase|nr:acetamidase/formamidase family protein [Chthoniobacteraceae bacterium]